MKNMFGRYIGRYEEHIRVLYLAGFWFRVTQRAFILHRILVPRSRIAYASRQAGHDEEGGDHSLISRLSLPSLSSLITIATG